MILLALALLFQSSQAAPVVPAGVVETYRFAAHKVDSDDPPESSLHVITHDADGIRFELTIHRKDADEDVVVRTLPDATFVRAEREVTKDGRVIETNRLERHGDDLLVERKRPYRKIGKTEESKVVSVPDGLPLAVDASLLLWMRTLSFVPEQEVRVFMVDFSINTVTATVINRGVESVTVPAGTFDCHHLKVEVKVVAFSIGIHFWVSTEDPHFLVRHRGRRGPFTGEYVTELTSIQSQGPVPPLQDN